VLLARQCMSLDCIRRWLFRSSVNYRQFWMQAEYGLLTSSSSSSSDGSATPQQRELPKAEPAKGPDGVASPNPATTPSGHLSSARSTVFPSLLMLPTEQQRVLLEALEAQQRSDADSRCSGLKHDCAFLWPGTRAARPTTVVHYGSVRALHWRCVLPDALICPCRIFMLVVKVFCCLHSLQRCMSMSLFLQVRAPLSQGSAGLIVVCSGGLGGGLCSPLFGCTVRLICWSPKVVLQVLGHT
jgi:hypothetical protein